MARPSKFTNDQVLDASLRLVHSSGPAGLTMSGVAQLLGLSVETYREAWEQHGVNPPSVRREQLAHVPKPTSR